jgi:hypothetical protein
LASRSEVEWGHGTPASTIQVDSGSYCRSCRSWCDGKSHIHSGVNVEMVGCSHYPWEQRAALPGLGLSRVSAGVSQLWKALVLGGGEGGAGLEAQELAQDGHHLPSRADGGRTEVSGNTGPWERMTSPTFSHSFTHLFIHPLYLYLLLFHLI